MRRYLATVTAAVLAISVMPPADGATVKVGARCSKVNLSSKVGSQNVVCLKSGGKLVWQIKKPTSTSKQPAQQKAQVGTAKTAETPATKASEAPAPVIDFVIPVAPAISDPLTFDNIAARYSEITKIAWDDVQTVLAKNAKVQTAPREIFIGPSSRAMKSWDDDKYLAKAASLWARFTQPDKFVGIYLNGDDNEWAKLTIDKAYGSKAEYVRHLADASCTKTSSCDSGNAGIPPVADKRVLGLGVFGLNQSFIPYPSQGTQRDVHEFTHVMQASQFRYRGEIKNYDGKLVNEINQIKNSSVPCWFHEGQPNFAGATAGTDNYKDYLGNRENSTRTRPIKTFTAYTSASAIEKFLDDQSPDTWKPGANSCYPPVGQSYGWGYGAGMLVVEALSAIGGAESSMALVQRIASGKTWDQAFLEVYGRSWASAKGPISKAVALEFSLLPPIPAA